MNNHTFEFNGSLVCFQCGVQKVNKKEMINHLTTHAKKQHIVDIMVENDRRRTTHTKTVKIDPSFNFLNEVYLKNLGLI